MEEFTKINNGFKEGICGLCPGGCAVEVEYKDGKIFKLRPSKKAEYSALCIRGSKAPDIIYSEDRLKKPLIRTGPKGTYEFREASWDEALDYAAEGFKKIADTYGPQALASHYGRGAFEVPYKDFFSGTSKGEFSGLFGHMGSPNNGSVGSLCYNSFGLVAPVPTMGIPSSNIRADIENSKTIFVWGTNPPTASPPELYQRIKAAQKNGARVITVDHYESIMAKNSDDYIILKSGTDGALILALMNYLIQTESYDRDFVDNYTHGFEVLRDYVKEFDLKRVTEICKISEDDFKLIAKSLTGDCVSLNTYTGLEYSNCGVQTIRAIYSLWALAGHLDAKGGMLLTKPSREMYRLSQDVTEPRVKPIGYDEFSMFCDLTGQMQFMRFPQAVVETKPYKLAGLFNVGSVISIVYPNSKVFEEALAQLDMFVTVDRFLTKDALYADVALPATTYFEDKSYMCYPDGARIREPIIGPIGKARSNIGIVSALAERLGFGEKYPSSPEDMIEKKFSINEEFFKDLINNPEGVYLPKKGERRYKKYESGGLRDDGAKGFPTKTGKFEFKSLMLESYGYEGLPKFEFPKEGKENSPKIFKSYPLTLNTGARIQSTFRTQHLNIDSLLKIQDAPHIIMNQEDAKVRGIAMGDEVIVSSPRGSIKVLADTSKEISPGDTELNIGGGQDFQKGLWSGANANLLTDNYNQDMLSGFPVFKDLLCQVEKA